MKIEEFKILEFVTLDLIAVLYIVDNYSCKWNFPSFYILMRFEMSFVSLQSLSHCLSSLFRAPAKFQCLKLPRWFPFKRITLEKRAYVCKVLGEAHFSKRDTRF